MRNKVIVVGSLNYDIILDLPRLPERGETLPVLGANFAAGGKGANQAVQAAKLGVNTYMVGSVGDDAMGSYLIKTAQEYGVNIDHIKIVSGESGMGIVNAVQSGEVYATIVRGANFQVTKEDVDAVKPLMQKAEIVILQLEIPINVVAYAITAAKEAGCKVLLNAAPAEAIPEEYLAMCDIIIVNEVEASFYLEREVHSFEEAIAGGKDMVKRWNAECIITLGSAGSVVVSKDMQKVIPANKVDAIDTTGAGDSFIGAVSYGIIQGMDIVKACEFATSCSAITVCGVSAQSSMPRLTDLSQMPHSKLRGI